jgi:ornithine cyclodeaminase
MTVLVPLEKIRPALARIDPIPLIEAGFAAYSRGEVVVPPVGEMIFSDPPGDVHIKSGYIKGDDVYVIKIASGFYGNPKGGRASSNGLMLVFNQADGSLKAILLDEGLLTDIRTAAAGAVAAKYLAPRRVVRAGILGAGTQGRVQLEYLRRVRPFEDVLVWGLGGGELESFRTDMEPLGFRIDTTLDAREVASSCNVIVTCTPSRKPLLSAGDIRRGTHITAVGSDTAEKQELDSGILAVADRIVVDSLAQSRERGEVYRAGLAGVAAAARAVELGNVVMNPGLGRTSEGEITVADLTGVAVQDIQIAKAVLAGLEA